MLPGFRSSKKRRKPFMDFQKLIRSRAQFV